MWLLDVKTRRLVHFIDEQRVPGGYAILSHTWEDEEVLFREIDDQTATTKKGYRKIDFTCREAIEDGFDYAWIDTCCINKDSSAELSEAINSMYRWYYQAHICYAYLADSQDILGKQGERSYDFRWFKRGWTLQELVAPKEVKFYTHDWHYAFSKTSRSEALSQMTGIDDDVLRNRNMLPSKPIARRLSWAAHRQTSREEDQAYSLLGICGVNIPLLYGEGTRAFVRLQEEIVKMSLDHSIFAWEPWSLLHSGLLFSPACYGFRNAGSIRNAANVIDDDSYVLNNRGLRITLPIYETTTYDGDLLAFLNCQYGENREHPCVLVLRKLLHRHRIAGATYTTVVCEVDRAPGSVLHNRCLPLGGNESLQWKDLVVVRAATTLFVHFENSDVLQIICGHPKRAWHSQEQRFRLSPTSSRSIAFGAVLIRHRVTAKNLTIYFGQPSEQLYGTPALSMGWMPATQSADADNCTEADVEEAVRQTLPSTTGTEAMSFPLRDIRGHKYQLRATSEPDHSDLPSVVWKISLTSFIKTPHGWISAD